MSIPANNAADTQQEQDSNEAQAAKTETSFAERVNAMAGEVKANAKGEYEFPEGTSEELRVAVMAERRRRDTQAGFTKTSQELKAVKKENSVLLKKAIETAKVDLTKEQQEELEDLKFSDPEAYRKKMNAYEADAVAKRKKELEEEVKNVSSSSLDEDEIERRKTVLAEFLEANPGFELDDDVIANDIPPRITKKLETGAISFEEFLQECHDYTKTGKVVKQDKVAKQANLSKAGGGGSPDKNAVKVDAVTSYEKEIF